MAVHVRYKSLYISLPFSAKEHGPYAKHDGNGNEPRTSPNKKFNEQNRRAFIWRYPVCLSVLKLSRIAEDGKEM